MHLITHLFHLSGGTSKAGVQEQNGRDLHLLGKARFLLPTLRSTEASEGIS